MGFLSTRALDVLQPHRAHLDEAQRLTERQLADMSVAILEAAFLPKQGQSDHEDARLAHEDLTSLDDVRLWRETERAKWLFAWADDKTGWIAERYRACQSETAKRGKARR